MIRRLFRSYSRSASKILDLNVFEVGKIAKSVGSSNELVRLNGRTSTQLNLFLSALYYNDISLGSKILTRIRKTVGPAALVSSDNIYFQCVIILFKQINHKDVNIRELKPILDMVIEDSNCKNVLQVETSADTVDLKRNIAYSFVNCYQNEANKVARNDIINLYKVAVAELGITGDGLEVPEEVREAFGLAPSESNTDGASRNTPTYKSLTFDALLSVIGERFVWGDVEGSGNLKDLPLAPVPLYEYYDSLPHSLKSSFLESYLTFNKQKQFHIESSCETLLPDFSPITDSRKSLSKFQIAKYQLVSKWIESSLLELTQILLSPSTPPDAAFETLIMHKNRHILKQLPLDEIIQLATSNLLSLTLTLESGYVKLIDICEKISFIITKYLKRDTIISKIVSRELLLQLSESIIHIIIQNSKISGFETADGDAFLIDYEVADQAYTSYFKRNKVIKCNSHFNNLFDEFLSKLHSKQVYPPMLSPPSPWTSPKQGGYLTSLKPIVLTEGSSTYMVYLEMANESGQLSSVYKSLNELGKVPWAINRDVLTVFQSIMQTHTQGFLNIPPQLDQIVVFTGSKPKRSDYDSEEDYKSANWKYKETKRSEMEKYHNKRSERFKYYYLEKFALALDKNGDSMYIPYGFDFRGRIYPLTTLLNNHLEDLVRALMMFWYSKPLGPAGLDWLKYQLAGVYGMDKLPKEDRIKWIDENMGNIRESAINPHKENAWWMNSENPWQTLALCKEFLKIDKYLLMGGDIEMYKCRIPIHQDGSCNGLQHYAALGLDLEGGKAVNLVPMKDGKRQDIYSTVLNLVENQVRKDCVNKTNDIAQISLPLLSRKIVKQTVMTSVYGVTRFGAYQQIKNRIKETLINGDVNKVVQYLTDLTLQSITKLFSKAKLIQNWLIMSSLRVIMSFDHETIEFKKVNSKTGLPDFFDDLFYKPMMWTSLSGLPIVQTYKKHKYHNLRTSTGTLKLKDHATVKEINLRKQKNGIAPNFIHSIDSIHLQMTCLKANREGLGFAAVHDSFWTYPNDVDSLSKIIREEFVTLHTSNIIENLRQDLLYTTRNSLQLVYIHKTNDSKFHSKLRTMRQARIGNILKGKLSKQELNEILYLESKDLLKSANSFKDQYYQLIDSCKPKLYFPISKNKMMIYSSNPKIQDIEENKITFLNYEPLLVPVKILHCPPKGHLNISHVRENKYFFS